MNCMRVPAAQTLLLYAKSLDTNENCTTLLCDEWIEVKFLDSELAQKLVSQVMYIRSSIDRLFRLRLENRMNKSSRLEREADECDEPSTSTVESEDAKEAGKSLERLLKRKLSEFLDSSVLYSLRRVLPAELQSIYVRNFSSYEQPVNDEPADEDTSFNKLKSLTKQAKVNEKKGGYKITDYLTYNCLVSEATSSIVTEYSGLMKRHWKCGYCLKDFVFDLRERMEHEVECQLENKSNDSSAATKEKSAKSAGQTDYYCSKCDKTLSLSAIDILRHKNSHA